MTFPQFAFNNVKRNTHAYLAYFLSSTFMVMIFFIFAMFIYHPEIRNLSNVAKNPTGVLTLISMQVATYVLYVFAILFVLYSMSAFLKSRHREFGILLMLGARNRQMNGLLFLENLIIGVASIVTGVVAGLLMSKLFLLFSTRVIAIYQLDFYWPVQAMLLTSGCFMLLFMGISWFSVIFIRKKRVLELLQGSSKPKREPRASIGLALCSIVLLTIGFVMLRRGLSGETLAIAAVSGIGGTYLFYSQLSVAVIRLLKRSKKRVWRHTNLLWISDIAYKLKDNARMLFLITVVTMIASTSAGFVVAIDQNNKQQFLDNPFALKWNVYQKGGVEQGLAIIEKPLQEAGIVFDTYPTDFIAAGLPDPIADATNSVDVEILQASQYSKLAHLWKKEPVSQLLTAHKVVAVYSGAKAPELEQPLLLEGSSRAITIEQLVRFRQMEQVSHARMILIVDDALFAQLATELKASARYLYHIPEWDQIPSPYGEQAVIGSDLYAWNEQQWQASPGSSVLQIRSEKYLDTKNTTSIFSFIGFFIALIFSVSTASFLYYKFYTDLSADQRTYHSLSKIGMSRDELSRVASKQMGVIFYVPIVVSLVQSCIILKPMMTKLHILDWHMSMLLVGLAFAGAQTLYYVIARARYVKALYRIMV